MLETAAGDEKFKDFCWKASKEETTTETKEYITMEPEELRCETLGWIRLARERARWWAR
jgi:hypothetical protein